MLPHTDCTLVTIAEKIVEKRRLSAEIEWPRRMKLSYMRNIDISVSLCLASNWTFLDSRRESLWLLKGYADGMLFTFVTYTWMGLKLEEWNTERVIKEWSQWEFIISPAMWTTFIPAIYFPLEISPQRQISFLFTRCLCPPVWKLCCPAWVKQQ